MAGPHALHQLNPALLGSFGEVGVMEFRLKEREVFILKHFVSQLHEETDLSVCLRVSLFIVLYFCILYFFPKTICQ